VVSQTKPSATKVAELDNPQNDIAFTAATKSFIEKINRSPKGAIGFIIIGPRSIEWNFIAKGLIEKYRVPSHRIQIIRADCLVEEAWGKTEFWIVPRGADTPYHSGLTCDITCPTVEVVGRFYAEPTDSMLDYTADVRGGAQDSAFDYRWTVKGAKIMKGQNTPSITVQVDQGVSEIIVGFSVTPVEETCPHSATLTTKIKLPK